MSEKLIDFVNETVRGLVSKLPQSFLMEAATVNAYQQWLHDLGFENHLTELGPNHNQAILVIDSYPQPKD